jgi:hypothetical protein
MWDISETGPPATPPSVDLLHEQIESACAQADYSGAPTWIREILWFSHYELERRRNLAATDPAVHAARIRAQKTVTLWRSWRDRRSPD